MSGIHPNFESAYALLRWASTDMNRLQRSVERYFDGNPCIEVTELDPATGNYSQKVRFTKKVPEAWRRLTFRTVCDLRHSIDQAMFAAVQTVLGRAPDGDIYFPWSKNPTDLTHRRKKIPESLWPTLDTLEPYPRGDGYSGGDDGIYAIRNAAGPNKHRIAIKPQVSPLSWSFKGFAEGDWQIPFNGWDGAKNEFTVIENLPPGAKRDYTVEFTFDIAFDEVEGLTGKPVIPALDHFGRYATFVLLRLVHDAPQIASN